MVSRPWWLLPPGRIKSAWWIPIGAGVLLLDQLGGLLSNFPVIYILPVVLAAWYSGRSPAFLLALSVPLVRLASLAAAAGPLDVTQALTELFRGVVILFLSFWFTRLAELERDLDRRVKVLEGILPICAFCKRIRSDAGDWEQLEAYISGRSEAEFSHGICPSCGEKHYAGLMGKGA